MKTKRLLRLSFITLLLFIVHLQIFGQLKNFNNKGSINILTEKTALTISTESSDINEFVGLGIAISTILPPLIDLTKDIVTSNISKNALAYVGEYKCSASGDGFYKNSSQLALPKLKITRIVKREKDEKDTTAVEIILMPELSIDKTAYRYRVSNLIYNYSIAKTKNKYDYIDLNLEIKSKSIFVNNEVYKIADLRVTNIFIPMIHVGTINSLENQIYSGWFPLPTRSNTKYTKSIVNTKEDKTTTKTTNDGKKETTKDETSVNKYDVESNQVVESTGLYEIEVIATETNPYKIKAESLKKMVENTNSSIDSSIKALITYLTKTK